MRARAGFTLVELMIVIALIGVAVSTAVIGLRAYQRTSRIQKALSDVSALLERAVSQTVDRRVPYRIVSTTQGLTGSLWKAGAGTATYVESPPDRQVVCEPGVNAVPTAKTPTTGTWILERGSALTPFVVNVWHVEQYPAGWTVTLDPGGRVAIASTTLGGAK